MSIKIGTSQAKELLDQGMQQAEELIKNPSQTDELLIRLEDKLKEVPVIGETLSDVPLMAGLVKAYITREYTEVSPKVIACLAGAFLYLIRHSDLIPDSLPVIGIADDLAVLGLALKLCEPELKAYSDWRDNR